MLSLVATATTLAASAPAALHAQGGCASAAGAQHQAAAQPRIIVVPYTKEGEDIRTVLEGDFGRQLAIAKVKEAFDAQRFPTVDFIGAVRAMHRTAGATMESESDFRDRLFQNNRADIYVTTNFQPTRSSGLTSVTLILDAYLTANGMSLGSKTGRSTRSTLADTTAHVEQVVGNLAPELIDVMQTRFCEFQDEGVPLSVDFHVASGGSTTLESSVRGKSGTVADALEEWFRTNAYKGGYSIANSTKNVMQLTDVRLALRDANGRPASARHFSSEIVQYLKSIGVPGSASVTNGAIYVDLK
ncbi:MAG TPA: DUF6175 family protein [Gemmatirosa sp.]